MAYTARIPKHIMFRAGGNSLEEEAVNVFWDRLPFEDRNQKEVQKHQEKGFRWNYWIPYTQKEVTLYRKRKEYYVHANTPVKLKLVGWSGEHMLVSIPSGHIVDLTLDVFYHALRDSGMEKDNKTLKGEYVFAMANRKLIPVCVGSGLHKGIIEHEQIKAKPKLDVKKLVVGHAYSTPGHKTAIFLGYVNTETVVVDLDSGMYSWAPRNMSTFDPNSPVEDFEVRFLRKDLATLWFETRLSKWGGEQYTSEQLLAIINSKLATGSLYSLKCRKSHNYVSKVPDLYVNLPDDIVMSVRNVAEKTARERIKEARLRRGHKLESYADITNAHILDKLRHYDISRVTGLAAECNMTLYGLGVIRSDVFRQFEPWEKKRKQKS